MFEDLLNDRPSYLPGRCSTRKVVADMVIRNEHCTVSGHEGGG